MTVNTRNLLALTVTNTSLVLAKMRVNTGNLLALTTCNFLALPTQREFELFLSTRSSRRV